MTTDIDALTLDMLQFSLLLKMINRPELAQNYERRALELRWSDTSEQDVENAREWVRLTLKGGAGGLGDMHVHKKDGSVDDDLDQECQHLLQKLTVFADGGAEPASDLLRQIGNDMFAHDYKYFRQVEAPLRKGLFSRGRAMYEVMTAPGVTRLVTLNDLGEAVGYSSQNSNKDFQECKMAAHRLYKEGRIDHWVHYSSAQVIPGESLRNRG